MEQKQAPGPAIWSTGFQVHSYDVDVTQRATVPSLCRHFLEGAWSHAEALGIGFNDLAKQGRVWVLSRLLLEIRRRPRWGETVIFRTWPRGIESVFAMRDFECADSGGSLHCGGTSAWLVLNQVTRRPQRIQGLLDNIPATSRRMTTRNPSKLPARHFNDASASWAVRPSDIDVNAHVNSVSYVEWMLDTYTLDFHRTHTLERLEVNFTGETVNGDIVNLFSEELAPAQWSHGITTGAGAEVCRGIFSWRETTPEELPEPMRS